MGVINNSVNTTSNFVDVIYEMINQEINKTDDTVLCEICDMVDDAHYNVYVVPDRTQVISGVPNMTRFSFKPGDYCYVYKVNNQFTNAFICFKLIPMGEDGAFQEEVSLSKTEIEALGMKEDKINKITEINQNATDQQYPSAKSVYNALEEIKQIIAGRTSSYIISANRNTQFRNDSDYIVLNINTYPIYDTGGHQIDSSQLRLGDTFYVIESNWPDRWIGEIAGATLKLYKFKAPTIPVTDLTLNGLSVVNNTVGALTTSNGIASSGGNIGLSLSGVSTVTPKSMTLAAQNEVKIYLDQNGTVTTTSINDLDYTKVRVVESSEESAGFNTINNSDFLFVKNAT